MKVQKGLSPDNKSVWLVLDDNYLPIQAISKYLHYLDSLDRSPNTIQGYARNLKLYWDFLKDNHLDWQKITIENLSEFIYWLKIPSSDITSDLEIESKRSAKTINHILTTVCMFYEFHERIGTTKGINAYRNRFQPGRNYKSFLHGIAKSKETKTKVLKLKEPKTFPGCLTQDEIRQLIDGCNRIRDKFLLCLLHATGMRIGEVLGLRHEDIHSQGINEIHVTNRSDNFNNQ